MKAFLTLALLTALAVPASANSVPRGFISSAVRAIQIAQQRAAAAQAAQTLANQTGQPQYANGGVYNPQPAPAAPVVTP